MPFRLYMQSQSLFLECLPVDLLFQETFVLLPRTASLTSLQLIRQKNFTGATCKHISYKALMKLKRTGLFLLVQTELPLQSVTSQVVSSTFVI